jgi:hypothetical protein
VLLTLRVWRAFWTIMLGMKVARTADPSRGIRNVAPAPRWQRWSEGEVVRLVKSAWRRGYCGLACITAVAWDTQFSPVDARTLAAGHRSIIGGKLVFDQRRPAERRSAPHLRARKGRFSIILRVSASTYIQTPSFSAIAPTTLIVLTHFLMISPTCAR